MGRRSDTIEERLGAGPTALSSLRGMGTQITTSKLQAIINHFYNLKNRITLFNPTWKSKRQSHTLTAKPMWQFCTITVQLIVNSKKVRQYETTD